jgi:hypothetical protein
MSLQRLNYYSENRIGLSQRNKRIAELQAVAVDRNRKDQITGALIHDELWFLQALEGDPRSVRATFERIAQDPRHANVKIIGMAQVPARLFGEWSMGFAARTPRTQPLFGDHWNNKGINPNSMTEKDVLSLMRELARQGFMRSQPLVKHIPA